MIGETVEIPAVKASWQVLKTHRLGLDTLCCISGIFLAHIAEDSILIRGRIV